MSREDKFFEKAWACLRDMYLNSSPPLDIGADEGELLEKLKKIGGSVDKWYMNHAISSSEYDRIKAEHVKKCGFRGANREDYLSKLDFFLFNYSPTFTEES